MNRSEFLVKGTAVRKLLLFAINYKMWIRALSFQEKEAENKIRINSKKKTYRAGPVTLEKLSPPAVVGFNSWNV